MVRLWRDTDPPTSPGLRRSPWATNKRLPGPQDRELYRSFDFSLRVGDMLLTRGAAVSDVEASVLAAATAMGLERAEADVTFTAITLSVRPDPEAPPVTAVRVVRARADDHARLTDAHGLLLDLTQGKVTREEAFERLTAIERQPRPYPRWFVTLARGVLAAAIVVLLGGGVLGATVAFATGCVLDRIGRVLAHRAVPTFFLNVIGGTLATVVAVALVALGAPISPALVVSGGIIVLLPGVLLVTSMQDALTGFLVTGAARAFEAMILVAGIVAGVAIGLDIGNRFDVDLSVVFRAQPYEELALRTAAAAVAAAAVAVGAYTPRRLVPSAALAGATGVVTAAIVETITDSAQAAVAVAGAAVGALGYVLAQRQRALPLSLVVPGITPLLPGLQIYTSLLLLTDGRTNEGIVSFLDAAFRALAVASAVLLAETISRSISGRARSSPDED